MKLQTQIPLEKQTGNQIDYQSKLLLLGSCFAENIGEHFDYFKFQNLQNPFGILFHPKAIETLISNATHGIQYKDENIFFHNEQWHCFDAHSRLSTASKNKFLNRLNDQLGATANHLKESTHIIITFGTAWIYKNYKSNSAVANCHKIPQSEFIKELLSVEEVTNSINTITRLIHQVNPHSKIIFTVSPVRHLKDGFIENTQSKAHLISGIHKALDQQSSEETTRLFYFPSYEIMLDELRDYRFYDEDMLHPNKIAIQYIWEKFKHVWIASEAEKTMKKVDEIQKGMQHRPFNSNTEAHLNFLHHLELTQQELQSEFQFMDF